MKLFVLQILVDDKLTAFFDVDNALEALIPGKSDVNDISPRVQIEVHRRGFVEHAAVNRHLRTLWLDLNADQSGSIRCATAHKFLDLDVSGCTQRAQRWGEFV